jgi:hypothetical protein
MHYATVIEETRADILGDLFQGAITYGENGQFLTPESLTDCMAQLLLADDGKDGRRVHEPSCGSGRMLLSAAKVNPHLEFSGQDIDLRCVRMTAINLALRNLFGTVTWGNSLTGQPRLAYRTGFNGRGFIREVPLTETQAPEPAALPPPDQTPLPTEPAPPPSPEAVQQRLLFDQE